MRGQLTVRISDGVRDQHVTRFVKGLRFTKTAPGGHHSASVQIDAPEGLFPNLGNADRLFIYDGRTAKTMWDGYIENPGRTTVSGGARYDLSAMGGIVLASDNARPVVFVDRDLSHTHWRKIGDSESAQVSPDQAARATAGPAIKAQFMPGTPLGTNQYAGYYYTACAMTDQMLYGVAATVDSGKTDTDYLSCINFYDAAGVLDSSGPNQTFSVVNNDISEGVASSTIRQFALVSIRTGGATNVADDLTWSLFSGVVVEARLLEADGSFGIGSFPWTVAAYEVVNHLIGSGMLPKIDATNLVNTPTSYEIEQLTYLDGAKPLQILDDLSMYEPDWLWEILESNAADLHRFAYRPWPTTPRYEISGREFTETGGEADLCNRIAVNWTDENGAEQVTIRTSTVEALGSRVKDAEPITIPQGRGTLADAQRIGDEVLASLNAPTRSGAATVRQPILDRVSGQMVMPWEIEPGYLVRVRDIGVDLRLTEMTYEDTNCTTSLKLGTPPLTQAQRFARLGR